MMNMDLEKHIALCFDQTVRGEAMHNRNFDKTINLEGRRRHHCNGEPPEWIMMMGFAPGCVELRSVGLDPNNNLVKEVDIVHQGDSVVKMLLFGEFI